MHAIPVRRLTFEVPEPEQFHPIYMANHAAVSYNFTGLGLYVALLEPFIVKSLRRVLDRVPHRAPTGRLLGLNGSPAKGARTLGPLHRRVHAGRYYDETGNSTRGPPRRVRPTRSRPSGCPRRQQATTKS